MHELALAQGILDIVQQYVPERQARDIRKVRVRVGALAGVVADSLDFCFSAVVAGTPWSSARLEILSIPATASCRACGSDFGLDDPVFVCPDCGSGDVQQVAGLELQVADIELEDQPAEVS
jgi:hydrogenase nickel incorporation protein HypA/HybF